MKRLIDFSPFGRINYLPAVLAGLSLIYAISCTSTDDTTIASGLNTVELENKLEMMAQDLENTLAIDRTHLPLFDVVKDFHADTTGLVITTEQLQNAIDHCFKNGPGRVFFPRGIYLTGTLILKSGVHLEFEEGTEIIASVIREDYPVIYPEFKANTDRQVNKALFYAENATDISMTGKALIDFQGNHPSHYYTFGNDPSRPFGIRFVSSKNIYMSGLQLWNSPQWMQHYLNCDNVMLENINVFNHSNKNNDGIDIDGSRNVYVRHCRIDSDDDAICLKSNGPSVCENVLIENCIASSHCNALKLGTETTGGFKNIIYRNCKVVPSVSGRHHINGIETTRTAITMIITDGGKMENVWFDSIDATGCNTPIFVTLGNRSRKHTVGVPEPEVGTIEKIKISNFKASGAGPITPSVTGLNSDHRIKNVVLENVYLEFTNPGLQSDRQINVAELLKEKKSKYPSPNVIGKLPSYGFYFRYIDGLQLTDVELDLKCDDPREKVIIEDCSDVAGNYH
ncbi:MAG: glycoside hydrolase [Bacteroidetes bacterium]|nr:glycoside hydrolase [Bacteroidota bacterium]